MFLVFIAFNAHSRENNFFVGLGGSYGSGLGLVSTQVGASFFLYARDNFSLEWGPEARISFYPLEFFLLADADLFIRASYAINNAVGIYGKIPFGYSLTAGGGDGASGVNHGFNVGFFPGLDFSFNSRVGMYIEAGYLHRFFSSFIITREFPSFMGNIGLSIDF